MSSSPIPPPLNLPDTPPHATLSITPPPDESSTGSPAPALARSNSIVISPTHRPRPPPRQSSLLLDASPPIPPPLLPALSRPHITIIHAPPKEEVQRMFRKTLTSDLSPEEALTLMECIDQQTHLFKEFTPLEMDYLSRILTILRFSPGDIIIEAGEQSSFVGIVFDGSLAVKIGAVEKSIPAGTLLGEMSFFEGGTRTAAVTSQGASVVAMITFAELELLQEFHPLLRLKLMIMFAMEGMRKIRMYSAKPVVEEKHSDKSNDKDKESDKASQGQALLSPPSMPKSKAGTRRNSLDKGASGGAAPAKEQLQNDTLVLPNEKASKSRQVSRRNTGTKVSDFDKYLEKDLKQKEEMKQKEKEKKEKEIEQPQRSVEALFRIRMKSEEKKQQEEIEKLLSKRKMAEHKAFSVALMANAHKRELEEKAEELQKLRYENEDLMEWKIWAQKKQISDQKFIKEKMEEKMELQVMLSLETEKRKQLENELNDMREHLDVKVAERTRQYAADLIEKQESFNMMQQQIEQLQIIKNNYEIEQILHQQTKQQHELDLVAERKMLEDSKLSIQQISNEQVIQLHRSLSKQAEELENLKKRKVELEEALEKGKYIRDKFSEKLNAKDILIERLQKNLAEVIHKHSFLQVDIHKYKMILNYVLASILIRAVRRRNRLFTIYTEWSSLIRRLKQAIQNSSVPLHNNKLNTQQSLASPSSAVSSARATTVADIDDPPILTRKKTHLLKHDDLFTIMIDSLPSYRAMMEELISQKDYWHQTADSFFQRTIEMKQEIIDSGNTHKPAENNQEEEENNQNNAINNEKKNTIIPHSHHSTHAHSAHANCCPNINFFKNKEEKEKEPHKEKLSQYKKRCVEYETLNTQLMSQCTLQQQKLQEYEAWVRNATQQLTLGGPATLTNVNTLALPPIVQHTNSHANTNNNNNANSNYMNALPPTYNKATMSSHLAPHLAQQHYAVSLTAAQLPSHFGYYTPSLAQQHNYDNTQRATQLSTVHRPPQQLINNGINPAPPSRGAFAPHPPPSAGAPTTNTPYYRAPSPAPPSSSVTLNKPAVIVLPASSTSNSSLISAPAPSTAPATYHFHTQNGSAANNFPPPPSTSMASSQHQQHTAGSRQKTPLITISNNQSSEM